MKVKSTVVFATPKTIFNVVKPTSHKYAEELSWSEEMRLLGYASDITAMDPMDLMIGMESNSFEFFHD